jgi:hypothetical protein
LNGLTSDSMPGKSGVVFMVVSGVKGEGRARTVFAARVAGMDIVRSARPARVLPEATALIPVKAKTPEGIGGGAMGAGGKIQPNPTANDFNQFVLGGQLGFQQVQDGLRGQFTVGAVRGKGAGF